jgi:MGT family glycosyltransferase
VPFPWEKLDGRPLIYASLGTLQNGLEFVFTCIAEACEGLDSQLVIALGNRHLDAAAVAKKLPGDPLVVAFAPQLALLDKAAMIITHAGQNTALEALSRGLPMVTIPIANDQFGVASRLEWLGVAEVMQLKKLSAARLRGMVVKVLNDPGYRERAEKCRAALGVIHGPGLAADLVEKAIRTRQQVLRGQ